MIQVQGTGKVTKFLMRQSIYLREVVPHYIMAWKSNKNVLIGGRRENMVTYPVASSPGPGEDLLNWHQLKRKGSRLRLLRRKNGVLGSRGDDETRHLLKNLLEVFREL